MSIHIVFINNASFKKSISCYAFICKTLRSKFRNTEMKIRHYSEMDSPLRKLYSLEKLHSKIKCLVSKLCISPSHTGETLDPSAIFRCLVRLDPLPLFLLYLVCIVTLSDSSYQKLSCTSIPAPVWTEVESEFV